MLRTRLGSLLLVAAVWPGGVAAATLTWPGVAPCNTTLQACIGAASAGDTVQIASNGPIAENLTVDKSLALAPAATFAPVVNGYVLLQSTSAAAAITVQNLTVNGFVRGSPGTGNLTVHILDNTVSINDSYGLAIEISSGTSPPYGNVTSEIRGNTVTVTGSGGSSQCAGIIVGPIEDPGTATSSLINNTVTVTNCGQGVAVAAYNGPGEAMTVDIIGNRVNAQGTDDGIVLRNFEQVAGSVLTGRVINNLVTGQLDVAGFPGGIVVSADGFEHINATVVNNTVTGNDGGIGVGARTDLGASIAGVVANNIVANNSVYGLQIDSTLEATVSNSNNLVFNPGFDSFTPGPGTLTLDPQFVSPSDFHLQASSRAINAGSNARLPGDIVTDLYGAARVQFGVVDMGAYESGFPATPSVPGLSWPGKLALAVLLALGAVLALRRL